MKIRTVETIEIVTNVICDVCGVSTRVEGYGMQFGTVQARWGYGSQHDGECYEVHLCEGCFFHTLGNLRRERMVNTMFDEQAADMDDFGRVARDSFLGE